jgi:hypothetical protein
MRTADTTIASLMLTGCLIACGSTAADPAVDPVPGEAGALERAGTESDAEFMLLGVQSREQIEAAMPGWVSSTIEAEPDMKAVLDLADLETSAEVTVFFGSWCSDSQRELSRLWKAFDMGGGEPSFAIRYVGVDRSKREPAVDVGLREILYVPTFVVEDNGLELGQLIEQSPNGIETDLLMLLDGRSTGWVSARDDLPTPESGEDS